LHRLPFDLGKVPCDMGKHGEEQGFQALKSVIGPSLSGV
jgi:hypothetical protein